MRWIKPVLKNSLTAALGAPAAVSPEADVEQARSALLHALGEEGARLNPRLRHRLRHQGDPQALWYARSEVMAVLSQLHGEAHAVRVVQRLTPVFRGLVPRSLLDSCRLDSRLPRRA